MHHLPKEEDSYLQAHNRVASMATTIIAQKKFKLSLKTTLLPTVTQEDHHTIVKPQNHDLHKAVIVEATNIIA